MASNSRSSAVGRVVAAAVPILQCALAAGLAWWVSHDLLRHPEPFFAPISAVVALGVSLGSRVRRSLELLVGVSVGLGVGDLLIALIGSGTWQIMLTVAVAMGAAVALDGGPVIAIQAAGSAVLVAALPPGGNAGTDRMIDALVGGLVGIAVVAVVPTHPVKRARRVAADVLDVLGAALRQTADGLVEQNPTLIRAALDRIRGTQDRIDELRLQIRGGRESSWVSPLFWGGARRRLVRLADTVDPLDNAVRNVRVLVRRALTLVRDDEILDPRLVDVVEQLAGAVEVVRDLLLADPDERPSRDDAAAALRAVARAARPELIAGAGLSTHVVFAQLRSAIVDLLQVCGVSRVAALAILPPTVPNPHVPPAL